MINDVDGDAQSSNDPGHEGKAANDYGKRSRLMAALDKLFFRRCTDMDSITAQNRITWRSGRLKVDLRLWRGDDDRWFVRMTDACIINRTLGVHSYDIHQSEWTNWITNAYIIYIWYVWRLRVIDSIECDDLIRARIIDDVIASIWLFECVEINRLNSFRFINWSFFFKLVIYVNIQGMPRVVGFKFYINVFFYDFVRWLWGNKYYT